jgi:hypothetical protein
MTNAISNRKGEQMNALMFLAVNTVVLLSSVFFTKSLSLEKVRDNLLAVLTIAVSQIIGSMLLAGTLIGLSQKRYLLLTYCFL